MGVVSKGFTANLQMYLSEQGLEVGSVCHTHTHTHTSHVRDLGRVCVRRHFLITYHFQHLFFRWPGSSESPCRRDVLITQNFQLAPLTFILIKSIAVSTSCFLASNAESEDDHEYWVVKCVGGDGHGLFQGKVFACRNKRNSFDIWNVTGRCRSKVRGSSPSLKYVF
jgi:hypothetical protein